MRNASFGFYVLWMLIAAVSVHDGYLVLLHRHTIAQDEMNPVGQWLIAADGGGIRYILAAKLLGTICAGAVLLMLYQKRRHLAWASTIVVAAAQLVLLIYLTTG